LYSQDDGGAPKHSAVDGPRVMLDGMATYIGEAVERNLRVEDVVAWLQRFPGEAIVYARSGEPPAIVVRDKDNRRHLASLPAREPPSAQ
jgi:hypothetical protein